MEIAEDITILIFEEIQAVNLFLKIFKTKKKNIETIVIIKYI